MQLKLWVKQYEEYEYESFYLLKDKKEHLQNNWIFNLPIKELWSAMYIEREIWKGGKVVGEKSLKIILNRSISKK